MSVGPVGCWMPATAVGVGALVGEADGPAEGPELGPGVEAAGLQAARRRLAARAANARRGVPEAGGWSVMARQTTRCTDRFPRTARGPFAVPARNAVRADVRSRRGGS